MTIKLNAATGKKLIYFQLIYNLIIKFFITVLGFPYFLNYVTDIVTIAIYLCARGKIKKALKLGEFKWLRYLIIGYFIILSLSSLFNLVSPFLYVWAVRNTFRFLIFMLACVTLLDRDDIEKIFDILCKFNFVNFVLCMYEYFVLGCFQDRLGGMFGIETGCNGALNLYLCIVVTWVFVRYISKKEKLFLFLSVVASALIVATLAELKIFYVEFVIIFAMAIFLSKPSWRKGIIIIASIVGLTYSLQLLAVIFPNQYAVLSNIGNFVEYFDMSGVGGYNISRMHAFSEINEKFFKGNVLLNIFGYGFGNCEYSSISLFVSDFYKMNSTLNYRFFAHATIFLETGYVGIIGFIFILISPAIHAWQKRKKMAENRYYITVVIICSALFVIELWYNYAMKIEYAYMAYFVLTIIPIYLKSINKERILKGNEIKENS